MRAPAVLSCVALAASAALVATPAEAGAPPLTCGSVVWVSATLRADLMCPAPGPALTLAAGVNLNLAGHTLSGPGNTGIGIGVPVAGDVTIRNGTITGWYAGVRTVGTDDGGASGTITVQNLTFDGNRTGLDASGDLDMGHFGKDHVVTRSTFTHNTFGILASWFTRVVVSRTSLADNMRAIEVESSDVTVSDSRIERSTIGVAVYEGTAAVTRTRLLDNGTGVSVRSMGSATIADSIVKQSDVGVEGLGYTYFTLTGNTISANTVGVSFDEANGTVSGNTFRSNGTGFTSLTPPPESTTVQANTFRQNGDGIRIDDGAQTSVGGNTAINNTGWGIYAPGVVDLGGNTAHRNGNTPQCVGVVCPAS